MAYVKAEVDQMPHSWGVCQMSECVDVLDSQRVPVNHTERLKRKGNIPYYGATGQVGWIDGYLFDEELLLLGEDGAPFFDKTKHIAYIISGKSWVNNHAHVLRTIIELTSNTFLKHYLNQFDFTGYVSGTTRLKLNQRSMKTIPILVPPLNEQRRIVAKLEKLLQKVDACKERLDKIPAILKRFRQSILAAACSGRLTADWREKNSDVKPASELLKQIQEKRLRNSPISQTDMDDLPDTWVKTKIFDVYDINPGHKGLKIDEKSEVSFVPMKLIEEETGFMDASFVKKYKEVKSGYTKFIEDDVVFAKITPCMENGKIAIAKNLCNGIGCGTTELHVFRPVVKDTNNFLFYCLLQKEIREMAKNRFQGTSGHLRVPVDFFEENWFPLPPLEEQKEIIRRVEDLFKIADQIEERYKKAKVYVDKLTQSILAKAFRGELVPQDLNDEPALKLLKRIKEERSKLNIKPKSKINRQTTRSRRINQS